MAKGKTSTGGTIPIVAGSGTVRAIPLAQLARDPLQPRVSFDKEGIASLAESIRTQGLQQYPSVNFSYLKAGVPYYILKTGERRFRAHQLLKKDSMWCVVLKDKYDGQFSADRLLAQTSENFAREPHTHNELVDVVRRIIYSAVEEATTETKWGLKNKAIKAIAKAFGKSEAWVQNYDVLSRLQPEIRQFLDHEDSEKRLGFNLGMSLARAPLSKQLEIWSKGSEVRSTKGFAAMQTYITKASRSANEATGKKIRGIKPFDEKLKFKRQLTQMVRVISALGAGESGEKFKGHVSEIVGKMTTVDVTEIQGQLTQLLTKLRIIEEIAEARAKKSIIAR